MNLADKQLYGIKPFQTESVYVKVFRFDLHVLILLFDVVCCIFDLQSGDCVLLCVSLVTQGCEHSGSEWRRLPENDQQSNRCCQ